MSEQTFKEMRDEMVRGWKSGLYDGTECGVGSAIEHTVEIRAALPDIISTYKIKSINDAGCGDLHWVSKFDLGDVKYQGYDLVPRHKDVIKLDMCEEVMPTCDLIVCRDVFLHLSNDRIKKVIDNFNKSGTYCLISSYYQEITDKYPNRKNLLAEPLNFPDPLLKIEEPYFNRFVGLWKIKDLGGCIE
jgi:hypothetical protein